MNTRGRQLDLALPVRARARRPRHSFRTDLDRLVDTYNAQGKPDVVLSVTREQEQEIRTLMAYPPTPLTYRGHVVVIRAETEKL